MIVAFFFGFFWLDEPRPLEPGIAYYTSYTTARSGKIANVKRLKQIYE